MALFLGKNIQIFMKCVNADYFAVLTCIFFLYTIFEKLFFQNRNYQDPIRISYSDQKSILWLLNPIRKPYYFSISKKIKFY